MTTASLSGAPAESELARNTYLKVFWRIVPFLMLLYVIAYLDRVNVGFAKLQMSGDLGFSETVFGLGAGLFFIGERIGQAPYPNWTAVGVTWLSGFDFEIKVIARLPS